MRKVLDFIIIGLVMLSLSSCTHNNGDIGHLFGFWRLERIEIDGETDSGYKGNITWAFQGEIVEMRIYGDNHTYNSSIGTWERNDGYLDLNYTHSQDGLEPGTGPYSTFGELHWPTNRVIRLKEEVATGKRMQLLWVSDDGSQYRYFLKKAI